MPDLIGAPNLIGSPDLLGEPALLGSPDLSRPSMLFGRTTPFIPQPPSGTAFTPPDFGFTVSALQGEIGRMWVESSGAERVFDLRSGSETGTVYQDTPMMVANGPLLNRLRVFSSGSSIRFHATGQSLSSWAAANDGGTDEPDLAFHFYQSASNTVERRLVDRAGAGGGFLNFTNNSGELATFFAGLLVADTKLLIILADSA